MTWLTRTLFPLLAILLACPELRAEDKVQTVKGVRGPSVEIAVLNGLVQALDQVKGIRIDAAVGVRKKHRSEQLELRNSMERWFLDYDVSDAATGTIFKATNGLVRTYEILKQEQDPKTNDWIVDLEVTVPIYDAENPRENGLRTIAFAGFQTSQSTYQLAGARISATEVNRLLVDRCISLFSKSPRFEVLTRDDFLAELDKEYDLIGGAKMAFDEQIKLGNRMGADYIVVGTIEELSWEEIPFEVEVTGYKGIKREASYGVSFRVLDVATSKVIWADKVGAFYDDEAIQVLSAEAAGKPIADYLVESAAAALSAQVQGHLFPIQVIGVSGGRVLIKTDPSRTSVGDVYEVWLIGEPIVFEGEVLGADERRVATIRVADVREKFAYAELVQGEIVELTGDDLEAVCRRLSN